VTSTVAPSDQVAATLLLLWCFRRSDLRIQLAISAAMSMLWSYHKANDYIAMARAMNPYGDGKATGRILTACAEVLGC
jgi:hypothetical protein